MTVWKKAFELLLNIYKVSKDFPKEEKFGMTSDIRRAANSVVHNISEGFGRYGKLDKTRFYKISRGSAYELISQIMVSFALDFISDKEKEMDLIQGYKEVINELDSLINAVENQKR